MITYDLHVHTTASDGLFRPSQIVEKAVSASLKGIAITDHDSISGIREAVDYAAAHYPDCTIIPGIEINTNQDNQSVHVLGYAFDDRSEALAQRLKEMQGWREERAQAMIEKLKILGYRMTYQEVQEQAKGAIGRPHIARVLVQKQLVPTEKWAFDNLLTRGKPAYVPRHPFTPIDAAQLIHEFHGVTVLAHPGLIRHQKLVLELLDSTYFDGVEVYYPAHKLYQVQKYQAMAQERNLMITGGSDFHGEGSMEHASCVGFRGLDDENYAVFRRKINILQKKLDL